MTPTPEVQSDEPAPRRPRRWLRRCAGWLDRLGAAGRFFRRRRLLFLDDDPTRAEQFLQAHPRAVWVTNVPDCIARLAGPWDEVHLDHDLGGRVYVDWSDADTGMEVIRWLCKAPRPHLKRTRFFVHTHNETAGLLMVLLMQSGGYRAEFRPFGLDLERLLAHNEPHGPDDAGASRPTTSGSEPSIQPPPRTSSS